MTEAEAAEMARMLREIAGQQDDAAGRELATQIIALLDADESEHSVPRALELLADYAFTATDQDADFLFAELSTVSDRPIDGVVYLDPRNEEIWSLREALPPLSDDERELRQFVREYVPVPESEFQLPTKRRYGNDEGGSPPPPSTPRF